jgi:glycosyltransferase involved in cell wall biosynthesis
VEPAPKVSVIVPCHNSAAYLDATVASVVGQTLRDFEIVFVDDGSTDATAALIDQLIARYRDQGALPSQLSHSQRGPR